MVRKIDIEKIISDSTSPKKIRDMVWSLKLNPTPQEISVRRVQLHVDENPLEMVQLTTNQISIDEIMEGLQ